MNKIPFYLLYAWAWIHAILPLRVLYFLSDVLYLFVFYVVGYRRKLTGKNLQQAFPDLSARELLRLEKRFYRHFCDTIVETIKLLHISDEEMKLRMKFNSISILQDIIDKGGSFLLMLGHYGNWEWITSVNLWLKVGHGFVPGQVYRPLKSKTFDRFFLQLRARFQTIGFPKNKIMREIIQIKQKKGHFGIGFITDQKPSANNMHYWTTFLNQETAVLTGPERLAKQADAALIYMDIRKIKRGYYETDIQLISDQPTTCIEFELTERYIRLMETTILRDPANWLWTHNRWKFKR